VSEVRVSAANEVATSGVHRRNRVLPGEMGAVDLFLSFDARVRSQSHGHVLDFIWSATLLRKTKCTVVLPKRQQALCVHVRLDRRWVKKWSFESDGCFDTLQLISARDSSRDPAFKIGCFRQL
jgi:hypothetical protein